MAPVIGKKVLLIVAGGIAAYKSIELLRLIRKSGAHATCVLTKAGTQFVTPLTLQAISENKVFEDIFSLSDENEMGHIQLSRAADLVVVAPATADFMAKLANGHADDLATAVLLAARTPVLMAPAMNPAMWTHPATRRNHKSLLADGVAFIGPDSGEMAEAGEAGAGRMAEPLAIVAAVEAKLSPGTAPLAGRHVIVTSGPTHEPIDPVRYIANRSSGQQGHALAAALAALGARVDLVSGPVSIPDPAGVTTTHVETARQMRDAVERLLPADAAIFVAAVADWRPAGEAKGKVKKKPGAPPPLLELTENPDILATIGHHARRPSLVIGFAAETDDLIANATKKLERKGADLIVANDVSTGAVSGGGAMGGSRNRVTLISATGHEAWPELDKPEVARRLAQLVAERLSGT
jgi:phosphopantothenoylcysteine decarboxylase/phosphopantothenate--cysteine ligase